MILLSLLLSALLLWAACGFAGLPMKKRATAHVMFSAMLLVGFSAVAVAHVVAP